ncbi:hypothetical protein [Acinetobacter baumannii]|uniref:hypothetical protein n=1 Tax=Acinetobacter baumannii TaxID=470 RepID=UPI000DE5F7A1|nr:hypothetical protein [Acinetobacter baumannii]MDC4555324.1 hypothetical protein [Acinetobacter baumannii]MDC4640212.1 hypothetical protein [Acinetobacter baumannii]MDC4857566.1 hypothetical protein [Acinetobacter baumannii]QEI76618.1 hypothetical protein FYA21_15165 [Acinetobacter baumannii]SSS47099.1 Uncharacterised protein [Acinetobacter baumannii]
MTNIVGIEIEGGDGVTISKTKINIQGDGKGITARNPKNYKFEDIEININTTNCLNDLKFILEKLNDNTKNPNTNKSFKSESLELINSIDLQKNKEEALTKISTLTTILSNWITIHVALAPTITPYLDVLLKLVGL